MSRKLFNLLEDSAAKFPARPAVVDPTAGSSLSYAELLSRADELAAELVDRGVTEGDRVGISLPKSLDAVVAIFGVLKCGAAYVPVDAGAPAERNDFIFADCGVRLVICSDGKNLSLAEGEKISDPVAGLAYILYTSGSTGDPKGVMLTHENALSFVDWCSEAFRPDENDRFSSHAPFHFDLSILDLYVPIKHGGAIILIGESLGKNARQLAPVIAEQKITVWYSTPTVLRLLAEFGELETLDLGALRLVLFAGEVFPLKHLRSLQDVLPAPGYWNLYGPTETNVCTAFELPREIPVDRDTPFPIGAPCSNVETRIADRELLVRGGPVTSGYWNLPERTAEAFFEDGWYRTGDIVKDIGDGVLDYVGRRDRMVKRRGFRVELGEIESGLYKHPHIVEAAAISIPDAESGVSIVAFVVTDGSDNAPKTVQMKLFSAKNLLSYMVPDRFVFIEEMPKTSTDKIDLQKLKELA